MKELFLIGDSIRLGYRKKVAELLEGKAIVRSSDDNARFTTYTLRYLHEWANLCPSKENVSLVHWNNGLWDACHWNGDEEALVPLPVYLHNIVRIRRMIGLLFPKAEIVFATTTLVAEDHPRIRNGEIEAMNEGAMDALRPLGVSFDDLHAVVAAHPESICPDKTHMTEQGFDLLGKQVASCVEKYLSC
jgi:hypothetical protein